MTRPVKKGSTDESVVIRIIDSTTGLPEEAVEYDTAGIALWYRREGETKTTITPAALAALDTAHTDGGIEHIDDGYYRLDPQDTAFAAGSGENGVMIGGTVTGMVIIGCYVPLVDYDPYDTVRLGLTALPNAAADAAGGLPISDTGGLDLDTKLANTNEITAARMGALTDWINGGRLDLILDIIAADTTTDIPALIAALNDFDPAVDAVAVVTLVNTLTTYTGNTPQTADNDILLQAIAAYIDTEIAAILADTNELQTNQGNWLTVTGQATEAKQDIIDTNVDTILIDTADMQPRVVAIEADTNELQTDDVPGLIAALNDLSEAQVNAQVDLALNTAIPGSPTAASINDYMRRAKYAVCNRWDIVEASGNFEVFDDSNVSFATVAAAFTTLAGVTLRKKIL